LWIFKEIGLTHSHAKRQNEKEWEKRAKCKILMDFQATYGDFRPFVISLYLEVFNLFGVFVIAFNLFGVFVPSLLPSLAHVFPFYF